MGMHGLLTRSRTRFYPNRLICKRFGVRPPPDGGPEMPGDHGGADRGSGQGAPADFGGNDTAATAAVARLELVGRASLEKIMIEANLKRMEERNAAAKLDLGGHSSDNAAAPAEPGGAAAGRNTTGSLGPALLPMRVVDEVPKAQAQVDPERNEALEKERPNEALFRAIFGDSDDDDD
jgi:G patch domain-containing protein 1